MAATAIGVAGLGACGLRKAEFSDDATLSQQITAVRVTGDSGDVTVRGGTGPATVHRVVSYSGEKPGATQRVEGGVLVLEDCTGNCSVDYTITVPTGTPINGKISSGSYALTGLGAVDVTSDSGDITMDGITGPVRANADSGTIDGRSLRGGRVDATADSGDVRLALTTPQDVTANAGSGSITVTVPAGSSYPADSYNVSAVTDSGTATVRIANDPAGAHRLDLRSDSGDVTVQPG
ncbi:DUF4097 family beta strand repeat-containing protein [Pseudonocardia sp. GCM10023141]|uniref:DUF4097 family beta strand repeat-containing protein n=1 Tax=Pseudonocardia sp. GCM10023141 TaxID=3252653 RepID=UPI003619BBB4